jgi:spermidine/putrescine-binding protein
MSFSDLFAKVKRYDQNASVIFDRAEPVGQATDLVLPDRRWLNRRARRKILRPIDCAPER